MGDRVFVRDADAVWEPDSGQLVIDFAVAEVAERAEPIARRALSEPEPPGVPGMTADEWYDAALDLEAVSTEGAEAAYRRALDADPNHPDAHLNLGRLLHEGGDLEAAERHYRAAVAADPGSARARYNLGVALEDLGRADAAMAAYREALGLDDGLATAHFNLSRLCEAAGDDAEALGHLLAYKRILERGERKAYGGSQPRRHFAPTASFFTWGASTRATMPTPPMIIATVRKSVRGHHRLELAGHQPGEQVAERRADEPDAHHLTHAMLWRQLGDRRKPDGGDAQLAHRVEEVGDHEPGGRHGARCRRVGGAPCEDEEARGEAAQPEPGLHRNRRVGVVPAPATPRATRRAALPR